MKNPFLTYKLVWISVCISFLFTTEKVCSQPSDPKGTKDGWAIQLGAGFMYAGNIGVLTEKQVKIRERLRISPFAAMGIGEGGTDSLSQKCYWISYTLGAGIEYGKKHRIVFSPHFVGQYLAGKSVEVKKNFLPGISTTIGYKGTADFGLIWVLYIGNIYVQDATSNSKTFSNYSHAGIGLGYKF